MTPPISKPKFASKSAVPSSDAELAERFTRELPALAVPLARQARLPRFGVIEQRATRHRRAENARRLELWLRRFRMAAVAASGVAAALLLAEGGGAAAEWLLRPLTNAPAAPAAGSEELALLAITLVGATLAWSLRRIWVED